MVCAQDYYDATLDSSAAIHSLLRGAGWGDNDTLLAVYYLGVDFEYRRQVIRLRILNFDLIRFCNQPSRLIKRYVKGFPVIGANSAVVADC